LPLQPDIRCSLESEHEQQSVAYLLLRWLRRLRSLLPALSLPQTPLRHC
jgi:hypothetical protein